MLSSEKNIEVSLRGVVAYVLDCDIVVSEFELQSHNYANFRTNSLRKCMEPFLSNPSERLNSTTSLFLQG